MQHHHPAADLQTLIRCPPRLLLTCTLLPPTTLLGAQPESVPLLLVLRVTQRHPAAALPRLLLLLGVLSTDMGLPALLRPPSSDLLPGVAAQPPSLLLLLVLLLLLSHSRR